MKKLLLHALLASAVIGGTGAVMTAYPQKAEACNTNNCKDDEPMDPLAPTTDGKTDGTRTSSDPTQACQGGRLRQA
jgi:hypothetical protein